MSNDERLAGTNKRDIAIEAGMQLVPYVGGALSTLYFGSKQERRFNRLETFYRDIASDVAQMKESIAPIEAQDPAALEAIMEKLHDKIEVEPTQEKREFFKSYFKNTLRQPVSDNFDERNYFLESLAEMSLLECEILAFINRQENTVVVGNIDKPGTDKFAIVGSIGMLKARGFLTAGQDSFTIGGGEDNSLKEVVSISTFGRSFFSFCLEA